MKNNKKGGATVYLVIIMLLLIAIAGLYARLNWKRFKAETSFALTMIGIVVVLLLVIFFLIRHSIRKARKEKEKEKARREREKFESELMTAGDAPETTEDGKPDMLDAGESAGKDKAGDLTSKEDQNE